MKSGEIVFKENINGLDVVVRYPKISDVKDMQEYINKISKEKTYITYQGEQFSFEEEKKYVRSQIEKIEKEKTVHLLIFVNNVLSGVSSIDLGNGIKSHVGNFGISIAKVQRGKGLGKILMELVVKESKKKLRGLKIIILEVFGVNEKARKMYKNFGFTESGKIPGAIHFRGDFIDDIQMYMKV